MSARCREDVIKESVPNTKVNVDLVEGVKEMNVSGKVWDSVTDGSGNEAVKERVSFGTNMSTEEESSATESVQQDTKSLDMLVSKMQARKIAAAQENNKAKRTALKVHSSSKMRK
jgi:hypothetical protein